MISIHALREEGDCRGDGRNHNRKISIHALREEGDSNTAYQRGMADIFLSTPSARRATERRTRPHRHPCISIHALREEGDNSDTAAAAAQVLFLSTPSARRATERRTRPHRHPCISIHALREEGDLYGIESQRRRPISIHALREEGDSGFSGDTLQTSNFYPRPPRGGRQ